MSEVRVRFAPSPTGFLHVGGVRTALFNWLFARHHKGVFILRIEDTDRERSTPEAIELILDGMRWLGLDWDEGPFYQTERLDLYRAGVEKLLATGHAYRCYCTQEELEARREQAMTEKRPPMYNRACRPRAGQVQRDMGDHPHTIRFAAPTTGQTVVDDLIRGRIVFENSQLDDLIIARSDGTPTYNFCVVMDDAEMGITHVIRGDDHLNNTPRQAVMYAALGHELPRFAHLPMILGPDKKKLSKRDGAASVTDYRDEGLLPSAMINYLARLGWSHGDQEVFTVDELIEKFGLDAVGKSAAVFDREKLYWINGQHMKAADALPVMATAEARLAGGGIAIDAGITDAWRRHLYGACVERCRTVAELAAMIAPFYTESVEIDAEGTAKAFKGEPDLVLEQVADKLATLEPFNAASVEAAFADLLASTGLGLGKLASPVRAAVTGRAVSPGIYDVLALVGRERALRRIADAREWLKARG
ncbi:MAG: glutamate--tRNA ligase [Nitrospirota bacterium]|nr:glutamate--tRNA ligase [Nitrospirota bacterium]